MMIELLAGKRQAGESDRAVTACNDWLRMGIGRSLVTLHRKYTESYVGISPTASLQTLREWSSEFGWLERGRAYDATWEERKNAEREASLNYGLALDYERVERLKRLADLLEAQIYEQSENAVLHNIWLPDVKQVGSGEDAERVDIERFNGALIEQYRAVLDDIAKEVGGRIKRLNVDQNWRAQAIADIRAGRIRYTPLAQAFDDTLARQLFAEAGVPVDG